MQRVTIGYASMALMLVVSLLLLPQANIGLAQDLPTPTPTPETDMDVDFGAVDAAAEMNTMVEESSLTTEDKAELRRMIESGEVQLDQERHLLRRESDGAYLMPISELGLDRGWVRELNEDGEPDRTFSTETDSGEIIDIPIRIFSQLPTFNNSTLIAIR